MGNVYGLVVTLWNMWDHVLFSILVLCILRTLLLPLQYRIRTMIEVRTAATRMAMSGDYDTLCERCERIGLDEYRWRLLSSTARSQKPDLMTGSFHGYCVSCRFFDRLLSDHEDNVVSQPLPTDPTPEADLTYDTLECKGQRIVETQLVVTKLSMSRTQSPGRDIQLFLTPQPLTQDGPSSSKTVSSRDNASPLDMHKVQQWLNECKRNHPMYTTRCIPLTMLRTTKLRVIDCRTRRVRVAKKNEEYICLSYVWGETSFHGKLQGDQLPDVVPKTIEDAMSVAIAIDIPQLWVDQYCINQNDANSKHDAIASMHLIYGGAALTIIAAAGMNVSYGLPGVHGTPCNPPQLVRTKTGPFLISEDTCGQVRRSHWNTRGWTYQEALLAPLRLVFTHSQIYFQCGKMHCLEIFDRCLTNYPEYFPSLSTPEGPLPPGDTSNTSVGTTTIELILEVLSTIALAIRVILAVLDSCTGETQLIEVPNSFDEKGC
jgi:hypothetical protein